MADVPTGDRSNFRGKLQNKTTTSITFLKGTNAGIVAAELGIGAIEVPYQLVDVWILPFDDTAYPDQFPGIILMASTSTLDFSNALQSSFSLNTPVMAMPFGDGDPAQFYYKTTLDLSAATTGDYYYLRTYINDGFQSGLTEVPNNESSPFWYLIFSLKIVCRFHHSISRSYSVCW